MNERLQPVYIVDAVRTPIAKIGGALAKVRPDDLAAGAIAALVERSPELDPARIDDVQFGNGNGAGEENRNVARMAALLAGLRPTGGGYGLATMCIGVGQGVAVVIHAD